MVLYGYPSKQVNEYGLLELREITVCASPAVLREISRFFGEMAGRMEALGTGNFSHRHIQSVIDDWDRRFPESDIVVISPEGENYDRQFRVS